MHVTTVEEVEREYEREATRKEEKKKKKKNIKTENRSSNNISAVSTHWNALNVFCLQTVSSRSSYDSAATELSQRSLAMCVRAFASMVARSALRCVCMWILCMYVRYHVRCLRLRLRFDWISFEYSASTHRNIYLELRLEIWNGHFSDTSICAFFALYTRISAEIKKQNICATFAAWALGSMVFDLQFAVSHSPLPSAQSEFWLLLLASLSRWLWFWAIPRELTKWIFFFFFFKHPKFESSSRWISFPNKKPK